MIVFLGGISNNEYKNRKLGIMLSYFTDTKKNKPNRMLRKVLKTRRKERKTEKCE